MRRLHATVSSSSSSSSGSGGAVSALDEVERERWREGGEGGVFFQTERRSAESAAPCPRRALHDRTATYSGSEQCMATKCGTRHVPARPGPSVTPPKKNKTKNKTKNV